MKKLGIQFLIIAFAFGMWGREADAQELRLIGSNFSLSSAGFQHIHPSVDYNSVDNEYMAVWSDTRNGNNDIFGQRVAAAGALLGVNFPVIEFSGAQSEPFVVHNSTDNQYLVAWHDASGAFGRLLGSTGSPLGPDFFIQISGRENSIAYNTNDNEYLVTARGLGVQAQRVSNSGTLTGNVIVLPTAGSAAPNGQVAYNPNANEYLATWRDQTNDILKGQRISDSGALLGPIIVISPSFPGSGRFTASVAFDPTKDRYLAIFGRFQVNEILGQLVSGSGTLIGQTSRLLPVWLV